MALFLEKLEIFFIFGPLPFGKFQLFFLTLPLGMYDEPPTNKQGIQTNAELCQASWLCINVLLKVH